MSYRCACVIATHSAILSRALADKSSWLLETGATISASVRLASAGLDFTVATSITRAVTMALVARASRWVIGAGGPILARIFCTRGHFVATIGTGETQWTEASYCSR